MTEPALTTDLCISRKMLEAPRIGEPGIKNHRSFILFRRKWRIKLFRELVRKEEDLC